MKWPLTVLVLIVVIGSIKKMMAPPVLAPSSSSSAYLQSITDAELKPLLAGHRVTLVNFWASWCGPCKEEFPAILKLREQYLSQGLEVVFLNLDNGSNRQEAEEFLASQKVDFTTYAPAGSAGPLIMAIDRGWPGALPTSFFFNSKGVRVDSWQGEARFQDLEAKVQPLLRAQ